MVKAYIESLLIFATLPITVFVVMSIMCRIKYLNKTKD